MDSVEIIFDLDIEKCSACGACAIACMDQNDIDTEHCQAPLRVVYDMEETSAKGYQFSYISMACMHCADAPCIKGCPVGCIFKDEETNLTVFDTANCIGCHSCAMACPFGAPTFGLDGKMFKCDGCVERIKHGMEPACVRVCPSGALTYFTSKEDHQKYLTNKPIKNLRKLVMDE